MPLVQKTIILVQSILGLLHYTKLTLPYCSVSKKNKRITTKILREKTPSTV